MMDESYIQMEAETEETAEQHRLRRKGSFRKQKIPLHMKALKCAGGGAGGHHRS